MNRRDPDNIFLANNDSGKHFWIDLLAILLSVPRMVTGILVVFMLSNFTSASGTTCSSSGLCLNGGTCLVNSATGGWSCECPEHTVGVNCECDSSVCQNNRPCVNGIETFTCDCSDKFNGAFCEKKVGECGDSTCEYGSCDNTLGSYLCTCNPGYTGSNCDIDIDECSENVSSCGPEHECINTFGSYRCNCTTGYEGYNCTDDVDECVISNNCSANGDDNEAKKLTGGVLIVTVLISLSVLAVIATVLAVIKAVKWKRAVKRRKAATLQRQRDSVDDITLVKQRLQSSISEVATC